MSTVTRRTKGLWFALPWIIGLGVFTVYPFCASIYYSFTDFSVLQRPVPVGLGNFTAMARDDVFWTVFGNSMTYAALSIPAGVLVALTLALLMNGVKRGQAVYSVIFYLPQLVPAVASVILWMWIFNAEFGLLNNAIKPFYDLANNLRRQIDPQLAEQMQKNAELIWTPPGWLGSPNWAKPALVLMGLWGTGQMAFIYLAKLQDVPTELYEAAEIDGASTWQKVRYVTLPTISPIIFFNIVMAIIGTFQVFTEPYIMTGGGPARATYFLPQYIWDNAFNYLRMGYACALSWILFLLILLLTMLAFRLSRERVYYAGR
jgi:multiple sugar transport system permease protein